MISCGPELLALGVGSNLWVNDNKIILNEEKDWRGANPCLLPPRLGLSNQDPQVLLPSHAISQQGIWHNGTYVSSLALF